MKNLKNKVMSKCGAVTIEYVLVIVLVVLGIIAALTAFAGSISDAIKGQGAAAEKTANDSYCKTQGSTGWAGGYTNSIPNCK